MKLVMAAALTAVVWMGTAGYCVARLCGLVDSIELVSRNKAPGAPPAPVEPARGIVIASVVR